MKYLQLFKELIRKANITQDAGAIPFFTQGLKPDALHQCLLQKPKTLQDWYDAATLIASAKSTVGIMTSLGQGGSGNNRYSWRQRDPDEMEIDAVMIRTLSKDEWERHVKEGLCFVCHKSGHMSQECLMGKSKGNVRKGHKGKGRKRFMTGCHIWAALREDNNREDKEYNSTEEDKAKQYAPSWNNYLQMNASNFWQKSMNRIFRPKLDVSEWRLE